MRQLRADIIAAIERAEARVFDPIERATVRRLRADIDAAFGRRMGPRKPNTKRRAAWRVAKAAQRHPKSAI
jgi:hypothetical protein